MKKLLSILASVAVAGSSASAVVACSVNPTVRNNNSSTASNNGPSGATGNGSNAPASNPLDPTNNNGSNNGKMTQKQLYELEKSNIIGDMSDAAKSAIPMKLWGFNGKSQYPVLDYLTHVKGSNGKPILDDDTYGTISSVLGLIDGVSVPSPSALGATVSSALPLLPLLQSTISGAIGGQSGAAKIEKSVSKFLTPDIKKIVDEVLNNGSDLSKYQDLTFSQSLDSIAMGIAYLCAVLTGDFDGAAQFKNMTQPETEIVTGKDANGKDVKETVSQFAVDYIANKIVDLASKKVKFNIGNLATHAAKEGQKYIAEDDLDVISDTLQLLMAYVGQFDQFRINENNTTKGNTVFEDATGTTLPIYSTITKVRSEKIKDAKVPTKLNLMRFVSDLSYYLGDLNNANGVNRVQALLAIFFADDDRSSADKIILNWDNNGEDEHVKHWSHASGAEATDTKSMPSKLVQEILNKFMAANEPDTFKSGAVAGILKFLGLTWGDITTWTTHNVYMLIQSLVWNKGIELSDTGIKFSVGTPSAIGYGLNVLENPISFSVPFIISIDYPGLNVLSSWKDIANDGFMKLLFNDSNTDIYAFLDELSTNGQFKKFFGQLSGISDKIPDIPGLIRNTVMPMLIPFADSKETGKASNEMSEISFDTLKNHKSVTFEHDGKESILSGTFNDSDNDQILTGSKDSAVPNWDNSPYSNSYKHPTMGNVIADKYDASTDSTDVYVYANNIYKSNVSGYKNSAGQTINEDFSADQFAKSIKVLDENGNDMVLNHSNYQLINNNGGSTGYQANVLVKVTIKGQASKNMTVQGDTFWYSGYSMDWFTKTYHGEATTIRDHIVNVLWQKDDLGLSNKIDINPTNPNLNISSIDVNDGFEEYKHHDWKITDEKGQNIITNVGIPTNVKFNINVQTLANHSISWLLNTLGISSNAVNLPFMDNDNLGELILKIGSLIDSNKLEDYTMDFSKYQDLVNVVFGTDGKKDIVTRLLNTLTGDKNKLSSDLSSELGIDGNNQYEKTGLVGALAEAFTPGLIGADNPNSNTIMGDAQAASPLWDALLGHKDPNTGKAINGLLMTAWDWLNSQDSDALKTLQNVNADKYYVEKWNDNADKNFSNMTDASGTITYTYRWEIRTKQEDGSIIWKWRTVEATINMHASRKTTSDKWTIDPITDDAIAVKDTIE